MLRVALNFRIKEKDDLIEKLQADLEEKKGEFNKLEKVVQQQKEKNNVSNVSNKIITTASMPKFLNFFFNLRDGKCMLVYSNIKRKECCR